MQGSMCLLGGPPYALVLRLHQSGQEQDLGRGLRRRISPGGRGRRRLGHHALPGRFWLTYTHPTGHHRGHEGTQGTESHPPPWFSASSVANSVRIFLSLMARRRRPMAAVVCIRRWSNAAHRCGRTWRIDSPRGRREDWSTPPLHSGPRQNDRRCEGRFSLGGDQHVSLKGRCWATRHGVATTLVAQQSADLMVAEVAVREMEVVHLRPWWSGVDIHPLRARRTSSALSRPCHQNESSRSIKRSAAVRTICE